MELKRLLYCAAFVTGREGGGSQSGAVGFVLGLLLGDAVADEEVSLLVLGILIGIENPLGQRECNIELCLLYRWQPRRL